MRQIFYRFFFLFVRACINAQNGARVCVGKLLVKIFLIYTVLYIVCEQYLATQKAAREIVNFRP